MIYYLAAALFPLLCSAAYTNIKRKGVLIEDERDWDKFWLALFAIMPMFLLFVLRYKYIGPDTIGYVRKFETGMDDIKLFEIFGADYEHRHERGFSFYVKLISLITDSYTIFFLINGLIIFGTILGFSLKYTKNPFVFLSLFVLLGTYDFMLTGLRQSLAIIICVWSLEFVKKRKIILFLLTVTLAYFFHKSAVIFILVYPLTHIKRLDWMLFWYSIIAIIFIVGFAFFQNIFNDILGYDYAIEETGNGGIFLMLLVVLFIFSMYMHLGGDIEIEQITIPHFAIITIIFWLLRMVSRTAERISLYFIMGFYGYFANATQFRKGNLMSFVKYMLIFACIALFVYRNLGVTYKFFWQG